MLDELQVVDYFEPGTEYILSVLFIKITTDSLHVLLTYSISELFKFVDFLGKFVLKLIIFIVYFGEGKLLPLCEAITHFDSLALD